MAPKVYKTGFVVKAKTSYTDLNLINNTLFPEILTALNQAVVPRVKLYGSTGSVTGTVSVEFSKTVPGEVVVSYSVESDSRLDNDVWYPLPTAPSTAFTKGATKQLVGDKLATVTGIIPSSISSYKPPPTGTEPLAMFESIKLGSVSVATSFLDDLDTALTPNSENLNTVKAIIISAFSSDIVSNDGVYDYHEKMPTMFVARCEGTVSTASPTTAIREVLASTPNQWPPEPGKTHRYNTNFDPLYYDMFALSVLCVIKSDSSLFVENPSSGLPEALISLTANDVFSMRDGSKNTVHSFGVTSAGPAYAIYGGSVSYDYYQMFSFVLGTNGKLLAADPPVWVQISEVKANLDTLYVF